MSELEFIGKIVRRGASLYVLVTKEDAEKIALQPCTTCGVRIAKVDSPFAEVPHA